MRLIKPEWCKPLRQAFVLSLAFPLLLCASARGDELSPWRSILSGTVYAVAVTPSATPDTPPVIFAASGTSLLKSVNGGQSWTPALAMQTSSLAADPLTPGVVYAAGQGGLLRTADYGATWTRLGSFAPVAAVAVSHFNPSIIFADNRRSLNGGLGWQTVPTLPTFQYTLAGEMAHFKVSRDPNYPGLVFCVTGNGLLRSDDAGATWAHWGANVKEDTVEVDPVDAQYVYEGTCSAGSMRRYFPGGWSNLFIPGNGGHVHGFAVDPATHARVYAVNASSLYTSADFGATWTAETAFGEIPEGRMIIDEIGGNIYLPTFTSGLMMKMSRCSDADHDGYSAAGGVCGPVDCDDNDPARTPKAVENCFDSLDNNCNDLVDYADPWCVSVCVDTDGDGFWPTICGKDDCNNADPLTYPNAPEQCDCTDNDCDRVTDEGCSILTWYLDADGDGYGTAASTRNNTCQPAGYVANSLDCNDADAAISPAGIEVLNDGVDQDCNGGDLTLAITKALWTANKKTLAVEATTSLGKDANAVLEGYGPMTWKRTSWTKTATGVAANPGTVTVSITGGSISAPVATK